MNEAQRDALMESIRIQFNYGTLAGLAAFTTFLIWYYLGFNPLGDISWVNVIFPILFITLGIKQIRNTLGEGFISFREGLGAGFMISFVYASLFGMLIFLYGAFIDNSFFQIHITETMARLEQARAIVGEAMTDELLTANKTMTLQKQAIMDFQVKWIGGILLTLIIALIFRRKPKFAANESEISDEQA